MKIDKKEIELMKVLEELPDDYNLQQLYDRLIAQDYGFEFDLEYNDASGEAYISASIPMKLGVYNGDFVFACDAFQYGDTTEEILERIEELQKQAREIKTIL